MITAHVETLIVGAGLSGLTAAAYLAKAGHPVLILEKTGTYGGLLNSFERDGYVFDTGPRSIENSGIVTPMLRDLGIELEFLKSPVSIGIESEIINITSKESIDAYKKLLERMYPDSIYDIGKIFQIIDKVFKEMHVIYGFENPVFKHFREDRNYLLRELLPWLGRFLLAVSRMERMKEPVETYLQRLTGNQALIDIITQHFFIRTPTFFALGYFYVYLDYLYPKGGTGRLPDALMQKILDNKGKIQCNTEIVRLNAAEKVVQDQNGRSYTYDNLLWAANMKSLYRNLDTTGLDTKIAESITATSEKFYASRGGDSVFSLFLGVCQPPQTFAHICNGHVLYTPSRKGLGQTHLSKLKHLLAKGKQITKEEIYAWITTFCNLTTYEISIPSLRDPSLSPPGKTGLVVSVLFEYDLVRLIRDLGWYDECKIQIEHEMIDTLNHSLFKGLLDSIELQFSSSPLTIEKQFNSSEGGITGWTFERPCPVANTLIQIPNSVKSVIPNVLTCGQWAYSPAGIPTAILTGWYAADVLCKKNSKQARDTKRK